MSEHKIESALAFISPEDRELWVKIGMSIKSELGDDGFYLWDGWSQKSDSYNQRAAKAVWKSIKAYGKISIGSLFYLARSAGWVDTEKPQELSAQELENLRLKKQDRLMKEQFQEKLKLEGYRKAAQLSSLVIKNCSLMTHNYLRSKKLSDTISLVNEEGELIIPMRSLENEIVGLQKISWIMDERRWEKKMFPGMRAKGAIFRLGDKNSGETWLCEGYATGLSIEMALRRSCSKASVLVCFSDRNLVYVASKISGRKFVFADNDASQAGLKAAQDTGLPFCMSPELGEDANDLHVRAGILAVVQTIMNARKK